MTREQLTCTRCGKRLSRKTARQIDGKPVCSACLFGPPTPPRTVP